MARKKQSIRRFSAEEKIRIVLEGLRGEMSVAELCQREDIASNLRATGGARTSSRPAGSG